MKSEKLRVTKGGMTRSMSFQTAFLRDESEQILVEKARQIGFSLYTARKAVEGCVREGAKHDWWVCSKNEDAAKEFLNYCKKWAAVYKIAAEAMDVEVVADTNVFSLKFATGVKIYALSSNPDALAGKTGNVILDEFALHKDQQALLKVSSAVTDWGGQRIIISTHRGKQSIFYTLIKDVKQNGNPMRWSYHKVDLNDAIAAGIVERVNAKTGRGWTAESFILNKRSKCLTEADFLEEYMCIAQDSLGQLLNWETILRSVNDGVAEKKFVPSMLGEDAVVVIGQDVARKKDLHVSVAVEQRDGRYIVRGLHVDKDKLWSTRDATLDTLLGEPRVKRVMIDQTGIGDKYVEDAKRRRNGHKVCGINFTSTSKQEMAMLMGRLFEEGLVVIPQDEQLMRHLAAVEKEIGSGGAVLYKADSTEDGHADMFWALALALLGFVRRVSEGAFTSEMVRGVRLGRCSKLHRQ